MSLPRLAVDPGIIERLRRASTIPHIMHCHFPQPRPASALLCHTDLLKCKLGPRRRNLRKFAVFNRAATGANSARTSRSRDASRQAEQLSQLAKEVFDMALQSGPRGFTRSMQAANAFASIGRYPALYLFVSGRSYTATFLH